MTSRRHGIALFAMIVLERFIVIGSIVHVGIVPGFWLDLGRAHNSPRIAACSHDLIVAIGMSKSIHLVLRVLEGILLLLLRASRNPTKFEEIENAFLQSTSRALWCVSRSSHLIRLNRRRSKAKSFLLEVRMAYHLHARLPFPHKLARRSSMLPWLPGTRRPKQPTRLAVSKITGGLSSLKHSTILLLIALY